jgi:hypothetical protein
MRKPECRLRSRIGAPRDWFGDPGLEQQEPPRGGSITTRTVGAEEGIPEAPFLYNTETRRDMRFYPLLKQVSQLALFESF